MLSRRHLLATAASAFAAYALMPPLRAVAAAAASAGEAAKLNALMDTFFQEDLRQRPERATLLGLDTGANADLKGKLRDNSTAGIAADKALTLDQIGAARRPSTPARSPPADRVNYDTILYTLDSRARIQAFDFGGMAFARFALCRQPADRRLPIGARFPRHQAPHRNRCRCRRLSFAARRLCQGDPRQHRPHEARCGRAAWSPPDFILDTALKQMAALRTKPEDALVVTSIAKRAKEKGLPDALRGRRHAHLCREDRPRARSSDRRDQGDARQGDARCRRVEAAAGRGVLCRRAARLDHHQHDARRGAQARARAGRRNLRRASTVCCAAWA